MLRLIALTLAWPFLQVWLLLLLAVLGLISIVWNLAALLLYPLLPREAGLRFGRLMISRGYAVFWSIARWSGMLRLHAEVLDPLRNEGGIIVAANHPSMLDALMLVAHLPRSACIMKASLANNPLLGPGARLARYIRNDSPRRMVRQAVADLQQGGQLVLFPEGTRTTRWPINRFSSAFTLISRRAAVPVQTVFIDTDSPYLGKGWPLWQLPPLPIVFTVRLGRRFPPIADHLAMKREIEAYMADGVRARRPAEAPSTSEQAWLP